MWAPGILSLAEVQNVPGARVRAGGCGLQLVPEDS